MLDDLCGGESEAEFRYGCQTDGNATCSSLELFERLPRFTYRISSSILLWLTRSASHASSLAVLALQAPLCLLALLALLIILTPLALLAALTVLARLPPLALLVLLALLPLLALLAPLALLALTRLADSLYLRIFLLFLLLEATNAAHHGHEEGIRASMGLPWYFVM